MNKLPYGPLHSRRQENSELPATKSSRSVEDRWNLLFQAYTREDFSAANTAVQPLVL